MYGLESTAFVVLLFPSLIPSRFRPNAAALNEDEDEDEEIYVRDLYLHVLQN
jgi:hypothetical protein